jgi:hypothetical protein
MAETKLYAFYSQVEFHLNHDLAFEILDFKLLAQVLALKSPSSPVFQQDPAMAAILRIDHLMMLVMYFPWPHRSSMAETS